MDTKKNQSNPVLLNEQKIKLKSWNNDYLCRRTTEKGVIALNKDEIVNSENVWIVKFINYSDRGLVIKLQSCMGDYLYCASKKDGVVTSNNIDKGSEWILEFVKFNLEEEEESIGNPTIKLKACNNDSLFHTEKKDEHDPGKITIYHGSFVGHEWTVEKP